LGFRLTRFYGKLKYCGLDGEGNIHIVLENSLPRVDRFLPAKIRGLKPYQNQYVAVDIQNWVPKPKPKKFKPIPYSEIKPQKI